MARTGTRYTEEQIIGILKEADAAGASIGEVIRRHGISPKTYYRWKAKFAGMEVPDARRLRQLEEENRRLKHLVADLTLDNRTLKDLLGKRS
jgi:putative transposase